MLRILKLLSLKKKKILQYIRMIKKIVNFDDEKIKKSDFYKNKKK